MPFFDDFENTPVSPSVSGWTKTGYNAATDILEISANGMQIGTAGSYQPAVATRDSTTYDLAPFRLTYWPQLAANGNCQIDFGNLTGVFTNENATLQLSSGNQSQITFTSPQTGKVTCALEGYTGNYEFVVYSGTTELGRTAFDDSQTFMPGDILISAYVSFSATNTQQTIAALEVFNSTAIPPSSTLSPQRQDGSQYRGFTLDFEGGHPKRLTGKVKLEDVMYLTAEGILYRDGLLKKTLMQAELGILAKTIKASLEDPASWFSGQPSPVAIGTVAVTLRSESIKGGVKAIGEGGDLQISIEYTEVSTRIEVPRRNMDVLVIPFGSFAAGDV